ncbi:MAG: hypothetical protein RMM30_09730 [Armatimonadota bacterium]|nr:hypothetical protein [Armatimonadota bacterium]MDW8156848.1 hypothetical protein [Armatimonadota bacterium]
MFARSGARAASEEWLALAAAAAAVAGALALLVTAARLPLPGGLVSTTAFYRALVAHVTFSLVVWLLSGSVALALHRGHCQAPPQALGAAYVGAALIFTGALLPGRPVVVDYLPYVDSPSYLAGYGLFAAGAAFALGWAAWKGSGHPIGPRCLAVAYLATLVAVACGLLRVGGTSPAAAVWGAGHALQFVYVTALALAWYELAWPSSAVTQPEPPLSCLAFRLGAALAWIPALLYFLPDAAQLPRWAAANAAMGFALSIPTAIHLVLLAPRLTHVSGVEGVALRWSVASYALGGVLAPVEAPNTLQVTAHYHAMLVGGVTMAFMGAAHRMLRSFGRPVDEPSGRLQLHLFGAGVVLTVAALLVAAGHGLPRKAYLSGAHLWPVPVLLLGGAALLASVGGAWFLLGIWRPLRVAGSYPVRRARPAPAAQTEPASGPGRLLATRPALRNARRRQAVDAPDPWAAHRASTSTTTCVSGRPRLD